MNRNEFLHALGGKLGEELTTSQIEGHLKYYSDYIEQEESTGKSEQEVIESLGDPILLARTILEAPNTEMHEGAYQSNANADIYQEDRNDYQEDNENIRQTPLIQFNGMTGWGCLAVAIIATFVIGLILWLFGIVFKALTPVLVPALMVLFVVAILKQRR